MDRRILQSTPTVDYNTNNLASLFHYIILYYIVLYCIILYYGTTKLLILFIAVDQQLCVHVWE
jgi:hypothetical protein